MLFLFLQVARMRKFSYSGALVVCSPHTRIFTCHEWRKCRKCCPHTRKFCRSNLSRITSTRDKCARVRRALGTRSVMWDFVPLLSRKLMRTVYQMWPFHINVILCSWRGGRIKRVSTNFREIWNEYCNRITLIFVLSELKGETLAGHQNIKGSVVWYKLQ
jgi:hypothetical protein